MFCALISVFGSTSNLSIRSDILSLLRNKANNRARLHQISERMSVALCRHTKSVNAVHWSPTHGKFCFYVLFTPVLSFHCFVVICVVKMLKNSSW